MSRNLELNSTFANSTFKNTSKITDNQFDIQSLHILKMGNQILFKMSFS